MVMGKRGRPSAPDVCRVLAVFLSLFPSGKKLLLTFTFKRKSFRVKCFVFPFFKIKIKIQPTVMFSLIGYGFKLLKVNTVMLNYMVELRES